MYMREEQNTSRMSINVYSEKTKYISYEHLCICGKNKMKKKNDNCNSGSNHNNCLTIIVTTITTAISK